MTKKRQLSKSRIHYMEQRLAEVAQARSQPLNEADIERILADMQSPDEYVRVQAVRQVCPCRMPWDVFYRLRKAAKRLQKDSSPLVRAHARHVEQDAQEIESLEALFEWVNDEPKEGEEIYQRGKGKQHRRKR